MQTRRTTNNGAANSGTMNNAHTMSGGVPNGSAMPNRPLGSGIQKRRHPHGGQRQTQPHHHQQQQQQPQQPQQWRPQQPPQMATRQRHRPGLQTNNGMHPAMTSVDLSTSRAHEVQPSEAEIEIDEVDFDEFLAMPSEASCSRSTGGQVLTKLDGIQSTLEKMCEYLGQIIDLNQPPDDQVQDVQQDGAEYVEGFDPGAMPY